MISPSYDYAATVRRWVDGDTVDLRVDCGFHTWVESRFRLYGIDTPERGKPGYTEATEAAAAYAPPGATVTLESFRDGDKYGRWLAVLTTAEGDVINTELVKAGLAVPYLIR